MDLGAILRAILEPFWGQFENYCGVDFGVILRQFGRHFEASLGPILGWIWGFLVTPLCSPSHGRPRVPGRPELGARPWHQDQEEEEGSVPDSSQGEGPQLATILGTFWGTFGTVWGTLCVPFLGWFWVPFWEYFGDHFGDTRSILGEQFEGHFGDALGAILANTSGAILRTFWVPFWGHFESLFEDIESLFVGHSGAILGTLWAPF